MCQSQVLPLQFQGHCFQLHHIPYHQVVCVMATCSILFTTAMVSIPLFSLLHMMYIYGEGIVVLYLNSFFLVTPSISLYCLCMNLDSNASVENLRDVMFWFHRLFPVRYMLCSEKLCEKIIHQLLFSPALTCPTYHTWAHVQ